jgi:cellobiose phosphorylase
MRNGISDNLLWLPFITYRYIMETGDYSVLDEKVSFMDGGEETVKVHCEKAINRVWGRRSERGLPLIGEGDWNDGLSAVGWREKGESVWLGHFFVDILKKWSKLEEQLKNDEKAKEYTQEAQSMTDIINRYGWDGKWYIRATTDSGRILGSKDSETANIFLNAQTWSILSGVAPEDRVSSVQESLEKYLYREYGPILFYPAYKHSDPDIGYITRYGPGTRENGGLYSHAACWAIAAECHRKRPDKVKELLDRFMPPNRGSDPDKYCAEPYVLPGNVDGPDSPNFGRGGWTWYTGSASWLYTVGWDWILGLMPVESGLEISPCLPDGWDNIDGYRYYRDKKLNFKIEKTGSDQIELSINGKPVEGNILKIDDYKDEKEIDLLIKY